MVVTVKDKKAIREIFQNEFNRIVGANNPKIRNIMFLVGHLKEYHEAQIGLIQKLNNVTVQMNNDQAKMRILEKFIDDMGMVDSYQKWLKTLDRDLDKAENDAQP